MRKIVATLLLAMIAITASAAMTRREKKDLIAKLPVAHPFACFFVARHQQH